MNRIIKLNILVISTVILLVGLAVPSIISSTDNLEMIDDNGGYRNPSALGTAISIEKADNMLNVYSQQTVPYYRVLDEDRIVEVHPDYMDAQSNIPSEEEAKKIADSYLQSFGEIPEGLILDIIEQQYVEKVDYTSDKVVEKLPLVTEVTYGREINGFEVTGPGDFIMVSIGEDGKVLCHLKTWRTLEEVGEIEIISSEDALAKLERGEIMRKPVSPFRDPLTINEISLGYYSQPSLQYQEFYKPVWIFKGVDSFGEKLEIAVEATLN